MIFRYDPPVSPRTMARWQKELDEAVPVTDRLSRLVVRWESGDVWQPIQRLMLWQCVDPQHVTIEPWVRRALNGPSPRSRGHYCGDGYCHCEEKKNRWVGGATKIVDRATWQLYQETGLYGQRWWTIQGPNGGHRFQWANDELASQVSVAKGGPNDTPLPGDLPYAPFDRRVIRQIMLERRLAYAEMALKGCDIAAMNLEEQAEAKAKARALWDWAGQRADELWYEGEADRLPRFFEETYGRIPTGTRQRTTHEAAERSFADTY